MSEEIHSAQPKLKFIPPHFNPWVHYFSYLSLPVLLRLRTRNWLPTGIAKVEGSNLEVLTELYHKFQMGKVRFLMAFHHPEVDDPLSIAYLLSRQMPKIAHQQGISLQNPIHTHFLYDRGMMLWAGNWLGWLFSNLGGVPIRRGKRIDLECLRTARDLFVNGKFPIAIAPEGATNGHSGIVSPLESGVAQLGFWCVEDLVKANRDETVMILPMTIKYSYPEQPWDKLNSLLGKLEANSGLSIQNIEVPVTKNREEIYYQRILHLAEHLLSQIEDFYRRFYHQDLPKKFTSEESANHEEILDFRLQRLRETALQVAEKYFGLEPQGSLEKRCRHIEEAAWNYIYREDFPSTEHLNALPSLQRGLADWVAKEANLKIRHMRLVETFVAATTKYVREKPSFERFAEISLLMFDLLARIREGKIPGRPRLGWRKAHITIGEPISVTERWSNYQSSRKGAKQAVKDLTQDVQVTLEKLSVDI